MPVKPAHIIKQNGKDFVTYPGLLDLAHEMGLIGIKTQLVQVPSDANGNIAIVHAAAVTEKGEWHGIGDASAANVSRGVGLHMIRMAETRAKARALRDLTNVGITAFEELGGDDDAPPPRKQAAPRIPAEIERDTERMAGDAMSKLHKRYAVLSKEASGLGVQVFPVPHNASEDEITEMGIDLKQRIDEAKRLALAPVIEATRR